MNAKTKLRLASRSLGSSFALSFAQLFVFSMISIFGSSVFGQSESTQAETESQSVAESDATAESDPIADTADPKNSVKTKKSVVAKKELYELTFDDLTFKMKKTETFDRSMLTEKIVDEYDGSKVRLRGFIKPAFKQSGLTKFVFVRDNKECCFGPGAALYDCVLVRLAKGADTDYTVRPVTVEGDFYLKEYNGPDGKVWSIFKMKNGEVK